MIRRTSASSDSGLRRKNCLKLNAAALEGTVWRKLDMRILPLCTIFFLLAFLDRTNISNARVVGLQTSLAMSNYQLWSSGSLCTSPYIVAEFPTTLLLKYVGPDLMLPAMVTLWGVVSASQGLVKSYSGLLACRFFLGLIEGLDIPDYIILSIHPSGPGGLLPGIVLYLSFFYPRKRLQIRYASSQRRGILFDVLPRVATFFISSSLSGTFSGLLAAAIDLVNGKGGKPGWAWIFILEGIFTFVFGAYVISTLKHAGSVSDDDEKDNFSWIEVVRSAKSPHVWLLAVVFFFSGNLDLWMSLANVDIHYGSFEPTIVAGLGYAGNQAQLMSVPPFAAAFVLTLTSAIVSDRYQCRGYTAIFFSLLQVIGFAMYYANTSSHVRYGSLFFSISGAYCAAPSLVTWMANNSAPHVRRATAVAVAFIMTQTGGILATWLLGWLSPAPNYTSATITFIAMSVGMVIFSMANLVYLRRENRLKAERRGRMRKEAELEDLGDRSAWFIYSL
ncbi:major facilitator superfamily domain-containing protein [Lanmaoa asiatica]|nr:major facilitator superfamily domain-containing protein [Lanmaoa asiatica]